MLKLVEFQKSQKLIYTHYLFFKKLHCDIFGETLYLIWYFNKKFSISGHKDSSLPDALSAVSAGKQAELPQVQTNPVFHWLLQQP